MSLRTLPRSLAPLKDESLTGYLLRLAHRSDLTPMELVRTAGLIGPRATWLPSRLMVEIEPDAANRFATATRLTHAELRALTFADLRANYPPADPEAYSLRSGDKLRAMMHSETWVNFGATRYCPVCLAGDGSEIQNRHGGAWNKLWRLAPVFACLEHQRLLSSTCTICGIPAMTGDPAHARLLVTQPGTAELHPLQCRANCTGRYDASAHIRPAITLKAPEVQHLFLLQ